MSENAVWDAIRNKVPYIGTHWRGKWGTNKEGCMLYHVYDYTSVSYAFNLDGRWYVYPNVFCHDSTHAVHYNELLRQLDGEDVVVMTDGMLYFVLQHDGPTLAAKLRLSV